MKDYEFPDVADALGWLQVAVGVAVSACLILQHRRFVVPFLKFATRYLGLTIIVGALYLMVYGLLGVGLGIPYLFWHDDFGARIFSSAGATLLLAIVGVIAYYLDSSPGVTDRQVAEFLSADEWIKHQFVAWYSRWLPTFSARALALPRRGARTAGPADYVVFSFNALFDFVSITPLQSWLDPVRPNSLRLQRFLRAARGPFLLLLLAPAALPGAFTEVPRAAPTGKIGFEWIGFDEPPTYDVSRSPIGYGLGLAAWLLGIQAGVLVLKVFLRYGPVLYPNRASSAAGRAFRRWRSGPTWSGLARRLGPAWRGAVGFVGRMGAVFGAGRAVVGRASPHADCRHRDDPALCAGPGCPLGEAPRPRSAPEGCRARREHLSSTLVFASLFLMSYALMGYVRHLRASGGGPDEVLGMSLSRLPAAFALCVAMAVLVMAYATIAYLPRAWQVPVILGLVAWFGYANNDPFKNRFEQMDYEPRYQDRDGRRHLVGLRGRVDRAYFAPDSRAQAAPTGLIKDRAALDAWAARARPGDPDRVDGRPKLVLVAVSGGATRSAYWTAVVLDQLERKLAGFGRRVRLISGASGGMLGTACYVSYRRDVALGASSERQGARASLGDDPATPPDWVRDLPVNSMDPLARYIALSEIWKAAWPGVALEDRGIVLEKDWPCLRYPMACLAPLEARGQVPSLVFSPMIVEDGRRLLISNLDLFLDEAGSASPMILTSGRQVSFREPAAADGTEVLPYSLSGLEYFRLFPREWHGGLLLSTAVRMSASFPFVSPAVNLPTEPPRRVVDAGYYDNYGIRVAASWILRNRGWLARNTSGVLLVQVRDSSSVKDRLDVEDSDPTTLEVAARGYQFFTSPVDGIGEARFTTASFRNDADVLGLDSSTWDFGDDPPLDRGSFFSTVIFENSAEVSLDPGLFWDELDKLDRDRPHKGGFREVAMSWYLARAEKTATLQAIPDDPPHDSRFNDPAVRGRLLEKLAGQVFRMLPQEEYDGLTEPEKDRMRQEGSLCYLPGPERDLRFKRLEQLRNYQRLVNLEKWWRGAGRRSPAG